MADTPEGSARGKCPICGRPAVHEFRPFCSRRCADVDLARWLGGRYVIPGRADEDGTPAKPANGEAGSSDMGAGPKPKQ